MYLCDVLVTFLEWDHNMRTSGTIIKDMNYLSKTLSSVLYKELTTQCFMYGMLSNMELFIELHFRICPLSETVDGGFLP